MHTIYSINYFIPIVQFFVSSHLAMKVFFVAINDIIYNKNKFRGKKNELYNI